MTKGEQARLTAWRLKVLQQATHEQNVARVCRRFGISRKSFYKWKRRHTEHGDAGLCDRPRAPLRASQRCSTELRSQQTCVSRWQISRLTSRRSRRAALRGELDRLAVLARLAAERQTLGRSS
jgi:transposase